MKQTDSRKAEHFLNTVPMRHLGSQTDGELHMVKNEEGIHVETVANP